MSIENNTENSNLDNNKEKINTDLMSEDIFSELQDLDFWQNNNENIEKPKLNILDIVSKIISFSFWTLLIITWLLFFDSYIRTSEDNTIISTINPLCNFVLYWADNDENKECKSVPNVIKDLEAQKENLEKNLAINLAKLIPNKMQTYNIIDSEEVKFIQEKTQSKISIIDAIDKFNAIKNNVTFYKWADIICKGIDIDELWNMNTSCEILWWPFINSNSSRSTVLKFLKNIQASNYFTLLEIPKEFPISKYNNSDGWITAAFSTVTILNLKLKFNTANLQ